MINHSFLSKRFLKKYRDLTPEFGFNGVGEIVYYTHYSRVIHLEGRQEVWWETIERVVNGVFNHLEEYMKEHSFFDAPPIPYDDLEKKAKKMFDMMFHMKFLPGGRGLWAMGTEIDDKAALNNCGFVSTKPLYENHNDWSESFVFCMNMMMLGVGIGFDTLGIGEPIFKPVQVETDDPTHLRIEIPWDTANSEPPRYIWHTDPIMIEDSREGWCSSVGKLIKSFLLPGGTHESVYFDYSLIRPKGVPLKKFGGTASGPEPLILLHEQIRELLTSYIGKRSDEKLIVNLMNLIGAAVVAGGIRRTAMIALDKNGSEEFLELKDYSIHPERKPFGWASNNSVVMTECDFMEDHTRIRNIAKNIMKNGEPGIFLLQNAQLYNRMLDPPCLIDNEAQGTNPCGEMTLENFELCNLVEVFISKMDNLEEFEDTLDMALLYGKVVSTLYPKNVHSRKIMMKNHRIGIGLTGISNFLQKHSATKLSHWMRMGYNHLLYKQKKFETFFRLPTSRKLTTIKPSGTLSLLGGVAPGIHYPLASRVWRRICLNHNPQIEKRLIERGYDVYTWRDEKYVKILMSYDDFTPMEYENKTYKRSIWEQKALVDLAQNNWSDNQVSCTIYIPVETELDELVRLLEHVPMTMKSVSFLPDQPTQKYENMPYEILDNNEPVELFKLLNPPLTRPGEYISVNIDEPILEEFRIFCERCERNEEEEKKPKETKEQRNIRLKKQLEQLDEWKTNGK